MIELRAHLLHSKKTLAEQSEVPILEKRRRTHETCLADTKGRLQKTRPEFDTPNIVPCFTRSSFVAIRFKRFSIKSWYFIRYSFPPCFGKKYLIIELYLQDLHERIVHRTCRERPVTSLIPSRSNRIFPGMKHIVCELKWWWSFFIAHLTNCR